jgi:hypothetical protein
LDRLLSSRPGRGLGINAFPGLQKDVEADDLTAIEGYGCAFAYIFEPACASTTGSPSATTSLVSEHDRLGRKLILLLSWFTPVSLGHPTRSRSPQTARSRLAGESRGAQPARAGRSRRVRVSGAERRRESNPTAVSCNR